MLCVKCKKRTAVVFVSRMDGSNPVNEGYCLKCAKEMGIPQVNEMIKGMGMSDEDIEQFSEEFDQKNDSDFFRVKAELFALNVNITGKDVIQNDILDKRTLIVFFIVKIFDVGQGDGQNGRNLFRHFIFTLNKNHILGFCTRTDGSVGIASR